MKWDHTFRIAKYIRSTDGTQSYLALFSIRNEYMHIMAYYFTHTTSLVESCNTFSEVLRVPLCACIHS